ncbi:hypothetical protein MJT46_005382 [Ovis ammon polii x Ovis aries]|nr:hypothetical protein MJT46_005382 [Ovis ammon polii x Ovis aries]
MRGAEGAKEQQTPKEEGLCPVNMSSSLQVHLPRSWASSSGSLKEKSEHSFFLFYYYRMEDEAVLDRGASFLKHVCDEEEVEGHHTIYIGVHVPKSYRRRRRHKRKTGHREKKEKERISENYSDKSDVENADESSSSILKPLKEVKTWNLLILSLLVSLSSPQILQQTISNFCSQAVTFFAAKVASYCIRVSNKTFVFQPLGNYLDVLVKVRVLWLHNQQYRKEDSGFPKRCSKLLSDKQAVLF